MYKNIFFFTALSNSNTKMTKSLLAILTFTCLYPEVVTKKHGQMKQSGSLMGFQLQRHSKPVIQISFHLILRASPNV